MRKWPSLMLALAALATLGFAAHAAARSGNSEPPQVEAQPVRALPVGHGLKLWVFVHPGKGGGKGKPPPPPPASCDSDNSQGAFATFAQASPLSFTLKTGGTPSSVGEAGFQQAIQNSLNSWDAVVPASFFSLAASGGTARPAQDGTNHIGWARIVPKTVLAAAWTWTDESGKIVESDVFFNVDQPYRVLSSCGGSSYDVENVGTHEVGHSVGLDHVSDPGKTATMYPSAPSGETQKRTLTIGDANGLATAG